MLNLVKYFKYYIFKKILLVLIVVFFSQAAIQNDQRVEFHFLNINTAQELQDLLHYSGNSLPLVCAHRGGARENFPENCIETFENTLKHTFAIIECDPRYSKDSVIVLLHDPTLERTTTGSGRVADSNLEELKKLRLKDPMGNITDYRIPTLDEALEWSRGKAVLLLDEKDISVKTRLKKITEHNAEANAIITIYRYDDAKLCYSLNQDIMIQVFISGIEKAVEFEKTGMPWKNIIASVGHKNPTDTILYKYIHQRGSLCTAASMETIDRKYQRGLVKDFNLLKDEYNGFLTIDFIQTDLPVELGSMLFKDFKIHSKNKKYFIKKQSE